MELIVPPGIGPTRLDRFLAEQLPHVSRRRIRLDDPRLLVNGRCVRRSTIVRPGDRISVPDELALPPASQAAPPLEIPILYEDPFLLALDKPANVPSVAAPRGDPVSVAAFLLARFPGQDEIGTSRLEAGLAHRLDRDTTGVLLAARTRAAYVGLRRLFSQRRIEKEYLALVHGDVTEPGRIRTPLAHDRRRRRRVRVCASAVAQENPRARLAETDYAPQVRYGDVTLLRILLRTGVMHQIRVHLASIGHPVVADRLYGNRRLADSGMTRQALHAHILRFRHPVTGAAVTVESPIPRDLEETLARCAARMPRR